MKQYFKPVLLSGLGDPNGGSGLVTDGDDVIYTGGGSEGGGDDPLEDDGFEGGGDGLLDG